MAYVITLSDGQTLTTISDGTIDNTTSIQLPGPNFVGYGQYLNENLVHMLENFAANSAPAGTHLQGQLWYNKNTQTLNVFTTSGFEPVTGITISGTQPATSRPGSQWFNTNTEQLSFYDGSKWTTVGPGYTRAQGVSGAIPLQVNDGSISGITHNIIQLQYGNLVIATVSSDPPFIPSPPIAGFTYINPGITINNTVTNPDSPNTITTNIIGNVAGNLVGNSVVANVFLGTLYGNVQGNLQGNVTATTLTGSLRGNVTSAVGNITTLTSNSVTVFGDVNIQGGEIVAGNVVAGNVVTGSITTTSGLNAPSVGTVSLTVSGIARVTNTTSSTSSINGALVVGGGIGVTGNINSAGSIVGISVSATTATATTAVATNFSTANAVITGGYINSLANVSATSAVFTTTQTSTLTATSGSVTGLTTLTANTTQVTNFSTANAQITGGNIIGVNGTNNTFTNANLITPVANTPVYSDNSTAVATTAFVQSVLPRGIILMWGGSVPTIPTGWQICDGSNGTPDLRNQFIVGAGSGVSPSSYAVGASGGATSISLSTSNLPSHAHGYSGTVTISGTTASSTANIRDPGHSHSVGTAGATGSYPVAATGSLVAAYQTTTATTGITDQGHTHNFTGSGNFSGNTTSLGSGTPVSTLPPYYALCFIQKMY